MLSLCRHIRQSKRHSRIRKDRQLIHMRHFVHVRNYGSRGSNSTGSICCVFVEQQVTPEMKIGELFSSRPNVTRGPAYVDRDGKMFINGYFIYLFTYS